MYTLTVQPLIFRLEVAVAATESKAVTEVEAMTDVVLATFCVQLTASFPSSSGFSLLFSHSLGSPQLGKKLCLGQELFQLPCSGLLTAVDTVSEQ